MIKRRHIYNYIVAAVIIAAPIASFAQESVYSLLGLGERIPTTNPRLEGLAGSGAALQDGRTINDINPAAWSWLTRTRLEARVSYTTNKSTLGEETTLLHNVRLNGFAFASPFSDVIKGSFAVGFNPVSYGNYSILKYDSLNSTLYERQGGISQLFLGVAARPHSSLALGARLDILFGNASARSQVTPISEFAVASVFERKYAVNGVRGTFGFSFAADSLIEDLKGLTLAASYSTTAPLTITRRTLLQPTNSALDSTLEDKGYSEYPGIFTFGIGSRFGNRYRAEFDYTMQDLSNVIPFSPTETWTPDPRLTSGSRYSVGIERLPLMGEEARNVKFFDRLGLRLGFSFAALPYKPDTKTDVSEMAASLGFNIPMGLETMFDFSVTVGQRTPADENLLPKENFIRVGAALSLSERWFTPSRTDDD